MTEKLNCYRCRWQGEVPGSAHSSCHHPVAEELRAKTGAPMLELLSMLGGGRIPPSGMTRLGIKAHEQGIRHGWFAWPFNFDPVWLIECRGFEQSPAHAPQKSEPDNG